MTIKKVTGKCLIVEDDWTWHTILRSVPEVANCEVATACSLEEAHAKVEREFFHVALVDKSLTSFNTDDEGGLLVLNWLRDLEEGTQSILITAHGNMEVGFDAMHRGAIGVIRKTDFETRKFSVDFDSALERAKREQKTHTDRLLHPEIEILRRDGMQQLWEYHVRFFATISEDIEPVSSLLRSTLEPLAPLMPPKDGIPSAVESNGHILSSTLWSRAIGQPIRLVFGRKAEVALFRAARSGEAQVGAVYEWHGLSGFAEVAADLKFENFESPFDTIAKPVHFVDTTKGPSSPMI